MAELVEETPGSVLAVYAHPDDADIACGGTLARWVRGGAEVHLLICTDGARGTAEPTVDREAFARRRADELAAAAATIGLASHAVLGWTDGELEDGPALRGELVGWVRRLRPQVVLGHDPTAVFFGEHYFNHRDHRTAGWTLLDALAPAAALPQYFPERGLAHQVATVYLSGTLEPAVWVDISETIDVKVAAVACHRTQLTAGAPAAGEVVRLRAEDEGRRAGVAFAEGFRRLRLGG